jgi:hypothetical protein
MTVYIVQTVQCGFKGICLAHQPINFPYGAIVTKDGRLSIEHP